MNITPQKYNKTLLNPLSLSPREDLFEFEFPKDFIPDEIKDKYAKVIYNAGKGVITDPIAYLNESIQGISIPGISSMTIEQTMPGGSHPMGSLHKMPSHTEVEPTADNFTYSPANPLSLIDREFTVTLRKNQGLYNYFMLYETAFFKLCKQYEYNEKDDLFTVYILNEHGNIASKILIYQPRLDSIEGMSFSYNKTERSTDTFDLKFKFNNIDFEFV